MKPSSIIFVLVMSATHASAERPQPAYIEDHYEIIEQNYTEYIRTCENVTSNSSGANALGGMILGGLIGKGLSGNDSGAVAGAIIGGVIGADNGSQRTNTKQVCGPKPVTRSKMETVYSYSTVRFWHNNKWVQLEFIK